MQKNSNEKIKSFNRGRYPETLRIKYKLMRADKFRFLRATTHLFYEDIARDSFLLNAPNAWICGDLHLENLGSYKADNRVAYFNVNDFDECLLAPCLLDVYRLITSVFVSTSNFKLSSDEARDLCSVYVDTYFKTLQRGYIRTLEKQTARGVIKRFLKNVSQRKRKDSILSQTFRDFELILMDDNSSDNSRQILETYRSVPNVKIVFNEVNSGSSFKQWNKGAKLATGEYIWIAESDDIADNKFLSTLVPVLDNDPGIALVYAQSYEINERGDIIGDWFYHTKELDADRWTSDFFMSGNEMIRKYMIHINCIPNASGVLFRKDRMKAIGMADETFRLNGDWLFWIKLIENSTLAFVAKNLNYFRKHESSVRSLTQYTGLGLYEYSRIIEYVSEHLAFSQREKKKIIMEFYNKSKWSPVFHSWKSEPAAYKYLGKSYFILIKQNKQGTILFIRHISKRFIIYYIKRPFVNFFYKKIFPKSPTVKKIVLGIRNSIFGNPYVKK